MWNTWLFVCTDSRCSLYSLESGATSPSEHHQQLEERELNTSNIKVLESECNNENHCNSDDDENTGDSIKKQREDLTLRETGTIASSPWALWSLKVRQILSVTIFIESIISQNDRLATLLHLFQYCQYLDEQKIINSTEYDCVCLIYRNYTIL